MLLNVSIFNQLTEQLMMGLDILPQVQLLYYCI